MKTMMATMMTMMVMTAAALILALLMQTMDDVPALGVLHLQHTIVASVASMLTYRVNLPCPRAEKSTSFEMGRTSETTPFVESICGWTANRAGMGDATSPTVRTMRSHGTPLCAVLIGFSVSKLDRCRLP